MTSAHGRKKSEAQEFYDLKQQAAAYYAENGVPLRMEEILNSMFYHNPKDVYGHLANFFEAFAEPAVISKLCAREVLDGRGQSTIQTEVYCTVKNKQKLTATSILSNESYPLDTARSEDKEAAETSRRQFVMAAIELINGTLTEALTGDPIKPGQQKRVDEILSDTVSKLQLADQEKASKEKEDPDKDPSTEAQPVPSPKPPSDSPKKGKSPKGKKKGGDIVIIPDEPREEQFCGCNAICAASQAVCSAAAGAQGEALYRHVAQLRYCELPQEAQYHMPLPMVTILAGGKTAPGKLNCVKEFMVLPKPGMPLKESIKHISAIYAHCVKSLSAKAGAVARNVTDTGALMPSFDRVEQGLDLLQEAMKEQELTPGEHFNIAINCAGQEIYDYEKGKYEVVGGQLKAAEDMGDFWGDIINRYPAVIALIDPLRKQEREGWIKLCERVSEKCYVVGDAIYHRPGQLKNEEPVPELKTSAICLKLEQMNTVSDILAVCKKMEDNDNQIIIGSSIGETPDTFLADFAVGLGARFLKVGAPCRGERVAKLNRLIQIEAELESQSSLLQWGEHVFPIIRAPTPPPEGEEAEEGTASDESKSESKGKERGEKGLEEKGSEGKFDQ